MPKKPAPVSDTLVLSLVFQFGFVDVYKVQSRWRYISKRRYDNNKNSALGDFLGLRVYGANAKEPIESEALLECAGEQAFWKSYGDIIGSHKDLTPPEDAKPVSQLKLELDGVEEFNIWVRLPNFLLPIYHSLDGQPDVRRDGHYSWLALNLRHRFGHAVWTLGMAAGGDTRNWLWFKDAKWGATLRLNQWKNAGNIFGSGRGDLRENDEKFEFDGIAQQVSIPVPFQSLGPRSVLKSACERLLGVDAAIHTSPGEYKHPLSRLHISWEMERVGAGKRHEVLCLVFRRVFLQTTGASDPMFRPNPEESIAPRKGHHVSAVPFTLMQRPRPLAEIKDNPRLFLRRWYLQVSLQSPARIERFPDEQANLIDANYSAVLQGMFERSWEGLVRSLRPDVEHDTSALFGLKVEFKASGAGTQSESGSFNPLPEFDLAFRHLESSEPYYRRNERPPDGGIGDFRIEPRPPELSYLDGNSHNAKIRWFALQSHRDIPLLTEAVVTCNSKLVPNSNPLGDSGAELQNDRGDHFFEWMFKWDIKSIKGIEAKERGTYRIRAGSLDILPSAKKANGPDYPCPCRFYFRHRNGFTSVWNAVAPLQLAFYGLGWDEDRDLRPTKGADDRVKLGAKAWALSPDGGLRIPMDEILPGETDHYEAETEALIADGGSMVSADRPLVIGPIHGDKKGSEVQSSAAAWILELSEIAGQTFTRQLTARIKLVDPVLARKSTADAHRDLRTFYVDRAPFFVGLFELYGITQFAPEEGNEAAYFSTKGVFRGWQLRSSQHDYFLHLPPQGVGEAMEKGKRAEGYADIDEGQTVDFRFPPISTLTVKSSDWDRNYGPVPWNLRLTLNSLKDNRLAGLPLTAAEFEMLYGLRMKIDQAPYLRVAEVLARLGLPRRQVLLTPANREYWANPDDSDRPAGSRGQSLQKDSGTKDAALAPPAKMYHKGRRDWNQLLNVINSRLAVYEVFDDRQLEFDPKGEPVGLILQGDAQHPILSAQLRKAARLRVSMVAEPNKSGEDNSSPALNSNEPLKLLRGKTLQDRLKDGPSKNPQWWSSVIPNYDDGLAGSFAWAFESRLLYESLWASDPNPDTVTVVEAVEATLARLYFSALGGWSSQRAAFANGKIVVAVTVEMGRVSELRLEIIGRIGILWNKAKLVTVFRRSVLPSDQFQYQQDLHEGRPLLRKVEEYVEFLEKYRLADDAVFLRGAGQLHIAEEDGRQKPGCLKASSCEEKILVDSRWGTDVYDDNRSGIGFKVPLRKPGAPAHIYGPANLLLHFHADGAGPTSEVAGRIENLEDVLFWADVRLDKTADTNKWPAIVDVDVFAAARGDEANAVPSEESWADPEKVAAYEKDYWRKGGDVAEFDKAIVWGTPPVSPESVHCTFRIAGLTKEATLNKHLIKGNPDAPEQRPVGAILRNITISRGFNASRSDAVVNAVVGVHASGEHLMSFLEQIAIRKEEAGEQIFGWETEAEKKLNALGLTQAETQKIIADLGPAVAAAQKLNSCFQEIQRRAEVELEHLFDAGDGASKTIESCLTQPLSKLSEKLKGAENLNKAPDEWRKEIQTTLDRLWRELVRSGALNQRWDDKSKKWVRKEGLSDSRWSDKFQSDDNNKFRTAFKGAFQSALALLKEAQAVKTMLRGKLLGPNKLFQSDDVVFRGVISQINAVLVMRTGATQAADKVQMQLNSMLREEVLLQFFRRFEDLCDASRDPQTGAIPDRKAFKSKAKELCRVLSSNGALNEPLAAALIDIITNSLPSKATDTVEQRYVVEVQIGVRRHVREHEPPLLQATSFEKAAETVVQNSFQLDNILEQAVLLHPALARIIKDNLAEWAIQALQPENAQKSFDPWVSFKDKLDTHVEEQLNHIMGVAQESGEALLKQLGALQRLDQVLEEKAKAHKESIMAFFGTATGVQAWIEKANDSKRKAWLEIKQQINEPGAPLHRMANQLAELHGALKNPGDKPEKLLQEFAVKLRGNVQHAYLRAERELRGVTEELKGKLGAPLSRLSDNAGAELASIRQEFERIKREWLDDDAKQWTRALENVSGTIEHAIHSLDRAGETADALEKMLAKPLPEQEPLTETSSLERYRKQIRGHWLQFIGTAEELSRHAQLPWLRGMPQRVNSGLIQQQLQDQLAEIEHWSDPTVQKLISAAKGVAESVRKATGDAKNTAYALRDALRQQLPLEQRIGQTIRTRLRDSIEEILRPVTTVPLKELADKALSDLAAFESTIIEEIKSVPGSIAEKIQGIHKELLNVEPEKLLGDALAGFGIDPKLLKDLEGLNVNEAGRKIAGEMNKFADRVPDIQTLERGLAEVQDWTNRQRESISGALSQVRSLVDVRPFKEAKQAVLETFRAFGQVPKVPALNFTEMANLGALKAFDADVRGYVNNFNARLSSVSYAFTHAAKDVEARLRMTPVKSMVDRLKNAGGEVVEEVRMRAATVETAVRNIGQKVEADARRMIDNLKPSLKDLLPDFGGLKLEKLLAAAGLSDGLIKQFQQKLKTQHGVDPQTKTAFVDSRLENLVLDDSLTVFSFGPVGLRLRNVKMSSHLRIETGQGKETRRQSDGKLTADWDILVGGQAVITYEQAALENKDGHTKMELDPKKVRMPSILQSVADLMKSYNRKDDSGLQAGIINHLPTEITGYVKFNLDIPSAGAPTSGIQNLRISLFFELGLRFPRFPSLRDADLRISAGVGLSDKEAPFIIAIWILGGCGWFQLRLDYVVPFKEGSPRLDVFLSVGLGVSASLAFDCGFASGNVYVALAVEIECLFSNAKGQSRTKFSIVLTMAGNLNILGIINVQLLIVLAIGYTSPGPMIGTGMIRVKIKICWCFTLKVERSFTKRFSGGGGQSMYAPNSAIPHLAGSSAAPMPVFTKSTRERVPVRSAPIKPADVHRRAARMVV